jgi:hypothetical protein
MKLNVLGISVWFANDDALVLVLNRHADLIRHQSLLYRLVRFRRNDEKGNRLLQAVNDTLGNSAPRRVHFPNNALSIRG